VLADFNAQAGQQAAAEIVAGGGLAEFVEIDVSSEAAWAGRKSEQRLALDRIRGLLATARKAQGK